ncbi:hypothetical protein VTN77DRAFT_3444 [Rasamsonia byssochlamydoides]|uniref:uncharacterized protein n=1 Tax=Rasamsonia byssochlamydoides TaxID=89139 RepID=UPI0037434408
MANNTKSSFTSTMTRSLYLIKEDGTSSMVMEDRRPSTTTTASQIGSGNVDHATPSPENDDRERNLPEDEPTSPMSTTAQRSMSEDLIHAGSWIDQGRPRISNIPHRQPPRAERRHRPQTQLRAYLRQEPQKDPWNAFVAQNRKSS